MSTPSLVALEVSPLVAHPSTPAKKRRTPPSVENSLSKRTLILTSSDQRPLDTSQGAEIPVERFFTPRQLFPHGVARVTHQYTHGHPSPSTSEYESNEIWHSRHVLLPFNLRDQDIDIFNRDDVRHLLYNIFPGTKNVTEARYRSHLLFQVEKLPSRPWPLTVGGVPITILDDAELGRALVFPRQNLGNFGISICQGGCGDVTYYSDEVLRQLTANVNTYFQENLRNIHIVELMFTCERTFYIVLDDNIRIGTVIRSLPGKIANCAVGYLNNHELHRPSWADPQAKRQIEPQLKSEVVDDTAYDILRPGVMICSDVLKEHAPPAVFSTTSGVLVKNSAGDSFMTAASHGIGDSETVWQANCPDKIVGKAVVEIPFTDISLVKLGRDAAFVNETFEKEGGATPDWTRLATSQDMFNRSACYLNSPYTGNMEGSVVMKSARVESSTHPTDSKPLYRVYHWAFMGQEEEDEDVKAQPPGGTSGSVVWNDDGVILGFYHYYIAEGRWAGFSASVSASEVVEAGYTLEKETRERLDHY